MHAEYSAPAMSAYGMDILQTKWQQNSNHSKKISNLSSTPSLRFLPKS